MTDSPPHSHLTCEVEGCNNTLDYCSTDNWEDIYRRLVYNDWDWALGTDGGFNLSQLRCRDHHRPDPQPTPGALNGSGMQRRTDPHELALVPASDRRLLPEQCAARAEWHLLKAEEVSWDAEDDTFRGHLRMAEAWIQLGRMAASTD